MAYTVYRASEIKIPEIRHAIFLSFLEFVYTDHVDISYDSAMELFQAADRFGMYGMYVYILVLLMLYKW